MPTPETASILQEHCGDQMARAVNRPGYATPELDEALGTKESLSWIKNQSWPKVELESDCLDDVQAIRT
ncbi:hypothetical protein AgCh_003137 [Apium graveolens]